MNSYLQKQNTNLNVNISNISNAGTEAIKKIISTSGQYAPLDPITGKISIQQLPAITINSVYTVNTYNDIITIPIPPIEGHIVIVQDTGNSYIYEDSQASWLELSISQQLTDHIQNETIHFSLQNYGGAISLLHLIDVTNYRLKNLSSSHPLLLSFVQTNTNIEFNVLPIANHIADIGIHFQLQNNQIVNMPTSLDMIYDEVSGIYKIRRLTTNATSGITLSVDIFDNILIEANAQAINLTNSINPLGNNMMHIPIPNSFEIKKMYVNHCLLNSTNSDSLQSIKNGGYYLENITLNQNDIVNIGLLINNFTNTLQPGLIKNYNLFGDIIISNPNIGTYVGDINGLFILLNDLAFVQSSYYLNTLNYGLIKHDRINFQTQTDIANKYKLYDSNTGFVKSIKSGTNITLSLDDTNNSIVINSTSVAPSIAVCSDVVLTSLSNNDILIWNNATSKWVNSIAFTNNQATTLINSTNISSIQNNTTQDKIYNPNVLVNTINYDESTFPVGKIDYTGVGVLYPRDAANNIIMTTNFYDGLRSQPDVLPIAERNAMTGRYNYVANGNDLTAVYRKVIDLPQNTEDPSLNVFYALGNVTVEFHLNSIIMLNEFGIAAGNYSLQLKYMGAKSTGAPPYFVNGGRTGSYQVWAIKSLAHLTAFRTAYMGANFQTNRNYTQFPIDTANYIKVLDTGSMTFNSNTTLNLGTLYNFPFTTGATYYGFVILDTNIMRSGVLNYITITSNATASQFLNTLSTNNDNKLLITNPNGTALTLTRPINLTSEVMTIYPIRLLLFWFYNVINKIIRSKSLMVLDTGFSTATNNTISNSSITMNNQNINTMVLDAFFLQFTNTSETKNCLLSNNSIKITDTATNSETNLRGTQIDIKNANLTTSYTNNAINATMVGEFSINTNRVRWPQQQRCYIYHNVYNSTTNFVFGTTNARLQWSSLVINVETTPNFNHDVINHAITYTGTIAQSVYIEMNITLLSADTNVVQFSIESSEIPAGTSYNNSVTYNMLIKDKYTRFRSTTQIDSLNQNSKIYIRVLSLVSNTTCTIPEFNIRLNTLIN